MTFHIPTKPRTKAELQAIANPSLANQPEALPWVLYDTQTYVDNTTTRLTFFQTTNVDPSITNMENAGQLPSPQWFQIFWFGLDMLKANTITATSVVTGAWNDVQNLILVNRGHFTFNISNKAFGQFPISFLHASGGVTGFGTGSVGATHNVEYANNGTFDGGYPVGGAQVIPPNTGFNVSMEWPAAVDLLADVQLRFWMAGVLYRRVL